MDIDEEIERFVAAPDRQLVVQDEKPVLLDRRVFIYHPIEKWEELIRGAFPTMVVDENNGEEEETRQQVARLWTVHMAAHAQKMCKAPIPRRPASLSAQLSDLMFFIEMVDVAFSQQNDTLNAIMFHPPREQPLYAGIVAIGDYYWSEYCTRRNQTNNTNINTLWWIILCRIRYLCGRWHRPRDLINAYEQWPLLRYLKWSTGSSPHHNILFNNLSTCSWYEHCQQNDTDNVMHYDSTGNDGDGDNSQLAWSVGHFHMNTPIAKYKMDGLIRLLVRLHEYWRDVSWNPHMELLVVCIWQRILVFMFDDSDQTKAALNDERFIRTDGGGAGPMPRRRFIRFAERILFYHLMTIQMYWKLQSINHEEEGGAVPTKDLFLLTEGETRVFHQFFLNLSMQDASFQLIQTTIRRTAFLHWLLPGERDKHIEFDPTLDRRPVAILSLERRFDFGFMAQLIMDSQCARIIHNIAMANIDSNTTAAVAAVPKDQPQEFVPHAKSIYPFVIATTLSVWHTMAETERKSVTENMVDTRVHEIYTTQSMEEAIGQTNNLYKMRMQLIDESTTNALPSKKRKRPNYRHKDNNNNNNVLMNPLSPSDWLWLENTDIELPNALPIALKVETRVSHLNHPIVVNVRGEFWVVDATATAPQGQQCRRTRNMFQAFKWWAVALARLLPHSYSQIGDHFIMFMFESACRKAAADVLKSPSFPISKKVK